MNKIEKGKSGLKILGVVLLVLGLLCLPASITFIVLACVLSAKFTIAFVILAIIFAVVSVPSLIMGVVFVWTSSSLVATHGSLKEENLGMGTANMVKCSNCGEEVKPEYDACPGCGQFLKEQKICENCQTSNNQKNKHCSKCGKEF